MLSHSRTLYKYLTCADLRVKSVKAMFRTVVVILSLLYAFVYHSQVKDKFVSWGIKTGATTSQFSSDH